MVQQLMILFVNCHCVSNWNRKYHIRCLRSWLSWFQNRIDETKKFHHFMENHFILPFFPHIFEKEPFLIAHSSHVISLPRTFKSFRWIPVWLKHWNVIDDCVLFVLCVICIHFKYFHFTHSSNLLHLLAESFKPLLFEFH